MAKATSVAKRAGATKGDPAKSNGSAKAKKMKTVSVAVRSINAVQCTCSLGMCAVTANGTLDPPAPGVQLHPGPYSAYEIWDTNSGMRVKQGQVFVDPTTLAWSLYDNTPGTVSGGSYVLRLLPNWALVLSTKEERDFSC